MNIVLLSLEISSKVSYLNSFQRRFFSAKVTEDGVAVVICSADYQDSNQSLTQVNYDCRCEGVSTRFKYIKISCIEKLLITSFQQKLLCLFRMLVLRELFLEAEIQDISISRNSDPAWLSLKFFRVGQRSSLFPSARMCFLWPPSSSNLFRIYLYFKCFR